MGEGQLEMGKEMGEERSGREEGNTVKEVRYVAYSIKNISILVMWSEMSHLQS